MRWVFEALSFAALALTFGIVAVHWPDLPAIIPIHFSASGEVNGWGRKNVLIVLCLLNGVTWLLLTWAQRHPKLINVRMNVDRESPEVVRLLRGMVMAIKTFLMLAFVWIVGSIVRTALGRSRGLSPLFLPVFIAAVVVPVMVYSLKLRRYQR
jgi:uncharacterized membrane protein